LLVSCSPETLPEVLAVFKRHGFNDASVVGHIGEAQKARLVVSC
jgi:selenide,water dikinase